MLVFAVIEFGWAFFQINSVRHGANETLRLAAVNEYNSTVPGGASGDAQTTLILTEACSRMQDGGKGATVTLTITGTKTVGQEVNVVVSKKLDQLTNFYNPILKNITLSEDLEGRIEKTATYNTGNRTC